ncbi:Mannose-6-phosphate isomerase, cupin superfamily [Andreprevotia lacus DSM 23236]|jgi:quercetin dioxygenase-like cupin family protein|uniref:Mannose-6-phosphate isomerase, cupin superfamily n=1 Tax=Andreprevotia lacus DSM 23236 TaxID=1121001 RepID=A0A1W1XRG6_9NEIS|nr:cupin domain-containing protein [Andreprevotia lacus]SMC26496.1 Mannose-6-phosphate isomerase, cupin superfamily [Andreprevotia lacus DSM 23236]
MPLIKLQSQAASLAPWQSRVLATAGDANLKVLRMDGSPYPEEIHDYPESLLVIEGQLNLTLGAEAITVRAGELFVVPVGTAHAVAAGSHGVLVIMDR